VPVVLLRPFNTFGPRQSEEHHSTIIGSADPSCARSWSGDATTVRDLTFVTDTARIHGSRTIENLEYGQPYNAEASGRSVGDLINLIVDDILPQAIVQDSKRLRPQNSEVRALLADCVRFTRARMSPRVNLREGWKGQSNGGVAAFRQHVRRQRDFIT